MKLAIFDLDNTLLGGDSDHAWGEYLVQAQLVDPDEHRARNDHFYHQYQHGGLDMHEYVAFTIDPIRKLDASRLQQMHQQFMRDHIEPMLLPKSAELIASHKAQGHHTMIITATNEFITEPIARLLGVDTLLATGLEVADECYTGKIRGIPCFQHGKVQRLQQWLEEEDFGAAAQRPGLEDSVFYSDSFNDLPLLELASEAVAVDPDPVLEKHARERGWRIISLR